MAFTRLAHKALLWNLGTKGAIFLALAIYVVVSFVRYFMQTALHFYLLAFLVGMVQGGSQALSRSLFASMVPRARSAEFFALFAVCEKFVGIFGPALFAGRWRLPDRAGTPSFPFSPSSLSEGSCSLGLTSPKGNGLPARQRE